MNPPGFFNQKERRNRWGRLGLFQLRVSVVPFHPHPFNMFKSKLEDSSLGGLQATSVCSAQQSFLPQIYKLAKTTRCSGVTRRDLETKAVNSSLSVSQEFLSAAKDV